LRFDFIRREKKAYPVTVLCKVMEVSRSGFYDYLGSLQGSDDPDEVVLVQRELEKSGFKISYKRT